MEWTTLLPQDINLENFDNAEESPEEKQPNSAEKRINTLTRKFREEQRNNEGLAAQNDLLQSRIDALTSKIDALSQAGIAPTAPAPGKPDEPINDFFGTTQQKPLGQVQSRQSPLNDQAFVQDLIQSTVERAMQPFVEEKRLAQEQDALAQLQRQSFEEAAEVIPGIRETGSREQQLFDQILKANPGLEMLPNAPALVINAVAGIVGGQQQATVQEQKKQVATPPAPAQHAFDMTPRIRDVPTEQVRQTEQLKGALLEKGRSSEGLTPDEDLALIGMLLNRAKAK